MPQKYKKKQPKQKKQEWSQDDMVKAILKVNEGEPCATAAATFGVPRSTLQRKIKIYNQDKEKYDSDNSALFKKPGPNTVFTPEQEQYLVDTILYHEFQLFGFTTFEIRQIAFQLAIKLKIDHKFNMKLELAGKDWLQGFMQRHPQLTLRKPEHTSRARALGFNKKSVSEFFELLENTVKKHNITPDCMYNVDETPVSTVPKGTAKVLAARGQKQVGGLVSGERGEHITAEICFSASGRYMPPTIIFPRVNVNKEFLKGAPAGTRCEFHNSGYMQSDIFCRWMQDFIDFTKPTSEKKVLLLFDQHSTHVLNLEALELARDNNVVIIGLPPHTTHKLQPVDVSFNKPLSSYFACEHNTWMRTHGKKGQVVTLKNFFEIFTPAYERAAIPETAQNGFRKTGIHPLNKDIFTETDFAAAINEPQRDPKGIN